MSEAEALKICTASCLGCQLEEACPFPDIPEARLNKVVKGDYSKTKQAESARRRYQANPERFKAMARARRTANEARLSDAQRKIRTVRKSHNMTQETLAASIGVHPVTISSWEHGRSPANWELLRKVFPELKEAET